MKREPTTYNILMYSHDTYGLGHIRRTMAIASHLLGEHINILILTGSPIVGRFSFPERMDFVRIPGMIKKTNEEYLPLSIKIDPRHVLNIRKNIITATAKAFKPHLFIVDKEPLGLRKEVLPTLKWLKRCMPETRTILGLRDIMDDAVTVQEDWRRKGIYEILNQLYSEIWVYGNQKFYDPIQEYAIPNCISKKMLFTGYIPRKVPDKKAVRQLRREQGIAKDEKLVVVTTGGGGDGFAVMDKYLNMLESASESLPFKSVLITGPFMADRETKEVIERARRLGVRTHQFCRVMEKMLAAADLVVSMGGYNTVCEILSQGTPALIIPREVPRKEQLIRAQVLYNHNLVDYIPWHSLSPKILREKVLAILEHPEPYRDAISQFELTGYKIMRFRLEAFLNKEPQKIKYD
jgi:predicted glycosyltransferase